MIKEFQVQDAAKLADMWNASDEGWPGGFTHGLAYTPEIIMENLKKRKKIAIFLAWDSDKVVGFVELTKYWRERNTAYVGVLNVVPTHHGKGYGKQLLKRCVEKSTEIKVDRLDLHTWPGNLKAVPLYKKAGFFWVPKTSVHMKNFLPLIRNLEAAQPFFEKHDWYETFRRELKVEEDDFNGAYPHRWEENGDTLSVVIDAESGGVTHFENDDFSVSQKVGEPLIGKSVKVTWEIKNKTSTPFKVNLISKGEKGISITRRESILVEDEREIAGEAFIEPDIEVRREGEPPHLLSTEVIINGISIPLTSGLRVKYPIEVSTHPEHLFLSEGENRILVILSNNEHEKVEGSVTCENTGESHSFHVDPHSKEAVSFTIQVSGDGELRFSVEGVSPFFVIPVCLKDKVGVIQTEKEVIMENAYSRIIVSLLGGEASIINKRTKEPFANHISNDIGPPFFPSELPLTVYRAKTYRDSGRVTCELTADSKEHHVRLTRSITIDASPLIEVRHTVIPEKEISLRFVGDSIMDGGRVTIPLREGITSEPFVEDRFPLRHGDLPKEPSSFKEQWACYEKEGSVFGLIWEECTEIAVTGEGVLDIIMKADEMRPLYLYAGTGDWKDVRHAWYEMRKEKETSESEVPEIPEEPRKIWDVNPSVVMTVDDSIVLSLTLENRRDRPLKGTVNEIPFEVKRGTPFTFETRCNDLNLGVNTRFVEMETELFQKSIPLSLIRVGRPGEVIVCENDLVELDNGSYRVRVAPHFYGSLIFFGKDINHLLTSYPETTQFAWLNPWWGGIHPVVFLKREDFPGRMYKERFTYEIIDFKSHDIGWKGVKVKCACEEVKGVQVETLYATTAHSNLIMIENKIMNLTSIPLELNYGMFFFLQPEGSLKEDTLYYVQEELQEWRRTDFGAFAQCRDWAAVKGGDTFLTVIADSIEIIDIGREGVHFFTRKRGELNPRGTLTDVSYLVAADSLESSQKYKALRKVL